LIEAKGENLIWMRYLIDLGIRGTHPLFEPEEIRSAFNRDVAELVDMKPATIEEINKVVHNILQAPDIESQKDVIQDLKSDTRDLIVRLYFQMIDQNFFEADPTKQ
jgi:hypothetical protein